MGAKASERVADAALWLAVVLAPVAGGSSDPRLLPLLAAIVGVATISTLIAVPDTSRRLTLPLISICLGALALYTFFQAIPLPAAFLTQRAEDIRTLAAGEGALPAPISYEPGSTLIEAAKLLLYALVALIAYSQTRSRRGFRPLAQAIVVSGLAVIAVGLFHRLFHLEKLFGVLPVMRPAHTLVTAFVNPNHSAGYMTLVALTALGLAVSTPRRRHAWLLLGAAALAAVTSIATFSKGGVLALIFGLALFAFLLPRTKGETAGPIGTGRAPLITGIVVVLLGGVWFSLDKVLSEVGDADQVEVSLIAKLRALQDIGPMISEHTWLGIGRGAYVSLHPLYKSTEQQLLYYYPENIAAQVVTEWGAPVGIIVLGALLAALVVRLRRVANPAKLGAICGATAIIAHNLVDFSLELPGAALPVAAILGATSSGFVRDRKAHPQRRLWLGAAATVPVVLMLVLAIAGLSEGTPRLSVQELDEVVQATLQDRRADHEQAPLDWPALDAYAPRHPANAEIAVRLSYLAEISRPPDPQRAVKQINRALYLAPSYADGHLASGRLLVKAGHEKQGMEALRRAWELSSSGRRLSFIDQIIHLARSPEALLVAVPRRDEALDVPVEEELIRLARQLGRGEKKAWIPPVLAAVRDPELLSSEALGLLVQLAGRSEVWEVAERAIAELRDRGRADHQLAEVQVRLVERRDGAVAAAALLDDMLADRSRVTPELARLRLRFALAAKQIDRAQDVLQLIERASPADHQAQSQLEYDRAQLYEAEGRVAKAARALGRAIQLEPGNTRYRLQRARMLLTLQRDQEARIELRFVLEVDPGNATAKALLAKLDARSPVPPSGP